MRSKIEEQRGALVQELHKHRKPAGDFPLQSYLGSPHPVLGLSRPTMRRISSNFVKAHSDLSISHVNKLANSLWKGRTFEEKILAISILNRFHRVLDEHTWRRMDMSIRRRVGRYVIHLDQAPSAMPTWIETRSVTC